jgi:hypothetical protein
VKRADELGYARAWFFDRHMLIRELRAVGYNHFANHIRHGHPEMLEEWADVFAGV